MNSIKSVIFVGAITLVVICSSEYEGGNFHSESGGYGGGHEFEYGHGEQESEYYPQEEHSEDSSPQYHFEYSVHDPHTDDYKTHQESRDGDKVSGHYTVKEADGSLREVHYTADDKNGFQAVVTKGGKQIHPYVEEHQPSIGHDSHYF